MGWRSWNAFGNRITEDMMLEAADALVAKVHAQTGTAGNVSLCDMGYCSLGIDEGWEGCGAGVNGSQHDAAGNPTINDKFPDLGAVVKYGHFNNLKVGWYQNGCACGEKVELSINYEGDVRNLHDFGFDAVKLDGCGRQRNLTLYAELQKASGRSYAIENCHWGRCTDSDDSSCPTQDWCPFNWYRTSGDINSGAQSWYSNLQTAVRFLGEGDAMLSQPGCWAYPDMLEVGRVQAPTPDTAVTWNRAHFGAWCVISAPLILGLDLTDAAALASIIPIVGNKEAIAVSQQWAGHPGRLLATVPAGSNGTAGPFAWGEACDKTGGDATQRGWSFDAASGKLKAESGACLSYGDATFGNSALLLKPCAGASAWRYDAASKSFRDAATGGSCLDLFNGQGCADAPRANLYKCNGGKNQQWTLAADGTGTVTDACGACLGTKATPPPGASGAGKNEAQVWAKPQPGGKAAVLIINNSPATVNVDVDLAQARVNATEAAVRDIWAHKDLASTEGGVYKAIVGAYDSAFVMLAPATA
eukprot:g5381.t1